jgi:hypothetical protein
LKGAFTIIAVYFVLAIARRYMSAASVKPPEAHISIADLTNRFGGTQWIVGSSMVLVGVLFFFSTHAIFVWLNQHFAAADGPAEFTLWPQNAIWWFFPGFGALALSWEIVLQLWSDLGNRENAQLYNYWSVQKSGFNATKLLRWMALLIALPIGILTALALPMHAALRQDDIRDCGYAFASCKTFRYADARRITMIDGFRDREGKLTKRAGIVIDFADGRRWSSADIGDFSDGVNPVFAEFIEKKTHLPLDHAQTEADISRLNSQR